MKSILVKSLPHKSVIKDIAEQLKVDVINECGEYRLEIPEHLGEGSVKGLMLEEGMGIIL